MHLLVALWASPTQAGTWVRAPGHGYVQLGAAHSTTTQRFTEDGQRLPLSHPHFVPDNFEQVFDRGVTTQTEAQVYGELGLLPGIEAFGSLPLRHVRSRWDFALGGEPLLLQNTALGDATVGVRWGGSLGPGVGALAASVRMPLYDNAPAALGIEPGNADIYDDQPPVGPGTTDVDLIGALGASGAAWWAQLEAGVRLRNRWFGAQLPARVQLGVRPAPPVAVFGEVEAVAALVDGRAPDNYLDDYNKGPLTLDRQSHVRPALGVLVEWPRDKGTPGVLVRADHIVIGRRTSATTTITAGATFRW